jgi:HEAT repeat protein
MDDNLTARLAQFYAIDEEHAALLAEIQSEDWDRALDAADRLAEYGAAALPGLLPLLKNPSVETRRATALALRAIGHDFAVPFLVAAIDDPLNEDIRGSLAYALQTHDCAHLFLFLFRLALDRIYEVQNHAYAILFEQEFWFAETDVDSAQAQLDQYAGRTDRGPDSDLLIADLREVLNDLRGIADAGEG